MRILIFISALLFLHALPIFLYAQPGLPANPSQAPIDGGLGLLAAAGGAYAYKRLKDRKD